MNELFGDKVIRYNITAINYKLFNSVLVIIIFFLLFGLLQKNLNSNLQSEKTSYYRGNTHYFGSKTPEMTRKNIVNYRVNHRAPIMYENSKRNGEQLINDDDDIKRKPFTSNYNQNFIQKSSWKSDDFVQRSMSAMDVNGFLSVRRKKHENFDKIHKSSLNEEFIAVI